MAIFLAWRDEHRARQVLILERSGLAKDKEALEKIMEEKEKRIDDLRESRKIELPPGLEAYLERKFLPPSIRAELSNEKREPEEKQKHEPSEAKAKPVQAPPVVQNLRFTQKEVVSDRKDFPYALDVVIQTNVEIQPTAIVVECEGPIGDGRGGLAGGGAYMMVRTGVVRDHPNWYLHSFEFPPFTPSRPMILTLFSQSLNKVVNVRTVDLR